MAVWGGGYAVWGGGNEWSTKGHIFTKHSSYKSELRSCKILTKKTLIRELADPGLMVPPPLLSNSIFTQTILFILYMYTCAVCVCVINIDICTNEQAQECFKYSLAQSNDFPSLQFDYKIKEPHKGC